jgi:hypothetical protein
MMVLSIRFLFFYDFIKILSCFFGNTKKTEIGLPIDNRHCGRPADQNLIRALTALQAAGNALAPAVS